jgi:hypothetical protein
MESHFGHDFSRVRIHSDTRAAKSARAVNARAYTAGPHIVLGGGQNGCWETDPQLLAHELTHTLQQGMNSSPGATAGLVVAESRQHEAEAETLASRVLSGVRAPRLASPHPVALQLAPGPAAALPTSLGGYPEAERRRIRLSTVAATMIDAPFITSVFGTAAQAGGATTSYNTSATVVFDPAIPSGLQRGLTSTGAYLANQTNVLPADSTVTLVLDLTSFSGPNALFRFTRFNHGSGASAAEILLIENVGPAPAAASAPASVPTGSFQVRTRSFTVGTGWNAARFGQLQSALTLLPDAALDEAVGLTFSLRGAGTADEAGHYDAEHDEVEMRTNAFPTSTSRYGSSEAGGRNILHELGHVLDLRRLERSWRTFNTGGQTTAGRTPLLAARSLSGTRWTQAAGGDYEQSDARRTAAGNDFRQAAAQDGIAPGATATAPLTGAGPTAYANTDWQELFAESFALYVTNPTLFQVLRPHLYAYFSTRYPLPTAAASPTGGGHTP